MRLIYTPDGGDKREFVFRPGQLLSPEAEAIEDVGGNAWDSFEGFGQKFMRGNRRAYRAALWVLLRRERPSLKFSDLVLRVDEIEIDFEDDETMRIREAVASDVDIDPVQREHLLRTLDQQIVQRVDAASDVPKGVSEPGADATDST